MLVWNQIPNTSHTGTHTRAIEERWRLASPPSFTHTHLHIHTNQFLYFPSFLSCTIITTIIQHSVFLFSFAVSLLIYFSVVLFAFRFCSLDIKFDLNSLSLPCSNPSPTSLSIHLFHLKGWEWHQPPPPPVPETGPAERPQPSGPLEHSSDSFLPAQAEPHAP